MGVRREPISTVRSKGRSTVYIVRELVYKGALLPSLYHLILTRNRNPELLSLVSLSKSACESCESSEVSEERLTWEGFPKAARAIDR